MKKSICLILVLALMCTLSLSVFAAEFTDVDGHWAEAPIERWSDENVVRGYTDGSFLPDNYITRAEFITMVSRLFEPEKEISLEQFSDVFEGAWYYEAMSKAVAIGAINGYDNSTLRPNAFITRQEAIVILNRIVKFSAKSSDDVLNQFSDKDDIGSWAKEAIKAFVERGYVNGYEDGTIRPTRLITRAEAAKILDNLVGLVAKTAGTYDLKGVSGIVIVKAEDVVLENTEDIDKIIVVNGGDKSSLVAKEVDAEDVVVVNEGTSGETSNSGETTKPSSSSGGGGGGSSTPAAKTAVITLTSTSGDSGEEFYNVEKNGVEINKNNKITIVVDGETVINEVKIGSYANLKKALVDAINKDILDEEKVIRTIEKSYSKVPELRSWGRDTFNALPDEDQAKADELVDNAPVSILEVYEALGLTKGEIKELAISVIDNFGEDDVINALKQI